MNQIDVLDNKAKIKLLKTIANKKVSMTFSDPLNEKTFTESMVENSTYVYMYQREDADTQSKKTDVLIYSNDLNSYVLFSVGASDGKEKVTVCYISKPFEFDMMIEECACFYGEDVYETEREVVKAMYADIKKRYNVNVNLNK